MSAGAVLAVEVSDYWVQTLIKTVVVLVLVPTSTALIVQTFLFKTMAHMQSRLGPMEAGPHGSLQLMADGAKFVQKELLAPAQADRRVYALAPVVVLVSTFLVFVVVPAGPSIVAEDLDIGIFFAMAVSSISVLGILMAGWASANKYALIGGLRAAGQLIAYELPLILAVVGVAIQAETLSLNGIVAAQADGEIFGVGFLGQPFVLTQIIGFFLFLIATQAELTQTPFDMPVAESELVAGYQVEYSGLQFLFFYIGEFGTAFAFSAIASTLFLGGWWIPGLDIDGGFWSNAIGPVVLFTKIMVVAFIIFWVRFSYPRFREDQLQTFAWKYLIPIALLNILATGVLKVAF
jgi:NADH-quinone oxidoreductase subunit H